MQIAAQPAFNQSGLALHAAAGKITFSRKMYIATSANASAEPACDFVIAEVDVRAARRTDAGCCRAGNLLFALTFETRDRAIALPVPNAFELFMERKLFRRSGRILFQFQSRLGRRR